MHVLYGFNTLSTFRDDAGLDISYFLRVWLGQVGGVIHIEEKSFWIRMTPIPQNEQMRSSHFDAMQPHLQLPYTMDDDDLMDGRQGWLRATAGQPQQCWQSSDRIDPKKIRR